MWPQEGNKDFLCGGETSIQILVPVAQPTLDKLITEPLGFDGQRGRRCGTQLSWSSV